MYLPQQFVNQERAHACALMRAYPLASLISVDDSGLPYITPLPLHLIEKGADLWLLGHCAKANPHWQLLRQRPQASVLFMGPNAFMSARVYPDLTRVPSWNYLLVQARVEAKLVDTLDATDRLLKHLIADHDPQYAAQWRALGEDFQHKMMAGIVAFELSVISLECKFKLNQHRPQSHAAMYAAYSVGNDNQRALAHWMCQLGMVAPDESSQIAATATLAA